MVDLNNLREKDVEAYFTRRVKAAGGVSRKWSSPAYRGVPDRLAFFPNGELYIVEMKAPNKKTTPLQDREIGLLRGLGHNVFVLDSYESVDTWIDKVKPQ